MEKRQVPEQRPAEICDPKLPEFRAEAPGNRAAERVCPNPVHHAEVQQL